MYLATSSRLPLATSNSHRSGQQSYSAMTAEQCGVKLASDRKIPPAVAYPGQALDSQCQASTIDDCQKDKAMKDDRTIAATSAALASPATAKEDHSADDQMGVGLAPCTEFTKLSGKAPVNEMIFYSWAQGFITAANKSRLMQGGDSVNVSTISQTEQRKRLRDYPCACASSINLAYGVADLINSPPTNPGIGSRASEQLENAK